MHSYHLFVSQKWKKKNMNRFSMHPLHHQRMHLFSNPIDANMENTMKWTIPLLFSVVQLLNNLWLRSIIFASNVFEWKANIEKWVRTKNKRIWKKNTDSRHRLRNWKAKIIEKDGKESNIFGQSIPLAFLHQIPVGEWKPHRKRKIKR